MAFFIGVKERREYIGLNPLLSPFEDKSRKHMASKSVVCDLGLDAAPSLPVISQSALLYKWGLSLLSGELLLESSYTDAWNSKIVLTGRKDKNCGSNYCFKARRRDELESIFPPSYHHISVYCVCEAMYYTGQ